MRKWVDQMKKLGAKVDGEGLITRLEPDKDVCAKCCDLGKRLAG
jgi:hypothetical protein